MFSLTRVTIEVVDQMVRPAELTLNSKLDLWCPGCCCSHSKMKDRVLLREIFEGNLADLRNDNHLKLMNHHVKHSRLINEVLRASSLLSIVSRLSTWSGYLILYLLRVSFGDAFQSVLIGASLTSSSVSSFSISGLERWSWTDICDWIESFNDGTLSPLGVCVIGSAFHFHWRLWYCLDVPAPIVIPRRVYKGNVNH